MLCCAEAPDCWDCSSACCYRNNEVRHYYHYYTSAVSTSLASGMPANHIQVRYDHLQMPLWSGTIQVSVLSVVDRWQLRSADSGTLIVPHTRTMRSVGKTLLCRAEPHGTASPLNCGLHHGLPRHLQKDYCLWRLLFSLHFSTPLLYHAIFNWHYYRNMHIYLFKILSFHTHIMQVFWFSNEHW